MRRVEKEHPMCESNAYLISPDGSEELVMDSVSYVAVNGDNVVLKSLFGEQKEIPARLRELNLTAHRISLEKT
jgi:predicted RNA-binding protein